MHEITTTATDHTVGDSPAGDASTTVDTPNPSAADTAVDAPENAPADREAAKYRRRLRDTEKERDTLAARIEHLQRAEVARIAGTVLATPEDLFMLGVDLADVIDDDGNVDPAIVEARAMEIAATRPGLAVPFPDLGQGARATAVRSGPTWSDVFRPHA